MFDQALRRRDSTEPSVNPAEIAQRCLDLLTRARCGIEDFGGVDSLHIHAVPWLSKLQFRRKRPQTCHNNVTRDAVITSGIEGADEQEASDFGEFLFQQLFVVEVAVVTIERDKFIMSAEFDDASAVKYGDAIRIAHRRYAMGDEDRGSSLHHTAQMVQD